MAVNVVCVILAAKAVFLVKGVKPRAWVEKLKACQAQTFYFALWVVMLGILVAAIYLRRSLLG